MLTTSQQFTVGLYYPILDAFLMELNHRFSGRNIELMRAIHACNPQCSQFLEPEQLQPLADCYNLDNESLRMESILCKWMLAKKTLETTPDVFKELLPLKEAFPTLLKTLKISLTICVSSASCERSFSALKRIKTYVSEINHAGREASQSSCVVCWERNLTDTQSWRCYWQILCTW